MGELERERREMLTEGKDPLWEGLVKGLLNPKTLLLSAIYIFIVTGYYGLTFFLPSITAKMKGASVVTQTVITSLPYAFGLFAMLINSSHSDRTGERRWHTALPILLGGVALALAILSGDALALVVTFFCLVGIGVHAYLPVFWTWPTKFMAASVAASAIGLINSFGNLGGFFGPKVVGKLSDWVKNELLLPPDQRSKALEYLNVTNESGSYVPGMWFLVVSILIAGLLAILVKPPAKKQEDGR
jgi:MFS family permease